MTTLIGPSLTLPNIGAADAGTYSVAITNPVGTVTSAGAALTVGSKAVVYFDAYPDLALPAHFEFASPVA